MHNQHRWTKSAANLCLEFREDDGIAPRYLLKNNSSKKSSRKSFQLSKEAAHILSMVLTGEVNHPMLADLQIVSVLPEQDGKLLCMSVGHYACDINLTETEVLTALKTVQGQLRCALAQGLHRKRTPGLSFRYLGVIGKGDN